jgi:glycosyltransferase involved in cell wall biosynthesis
MQPLVSVIIPAYNRADLITHTLMSLINQSYTNWEAIVIDDNSTDNTVEAIELMASKDTRITVVVKKENIIKGAASSRNIGMDKSNGDFIIFLDSDDVLAEFALERRVKVLLNNPNIDFAVFHGFFFKEHPGDTNILWNEFTEESDLNRFLRGDVSWSMTGPMWRMAFLLRNRIRFTETLASGQDWDFHIRALLKKPSYKKIPGPPDYFVRRDEGGKRISSAHHSVKKYKNRMQNNSLLLKLLSRKNRRLLKVHIIRETIFAIARNPDREILKVFLRMNVIRDSLDRLSWKLFFYTVIFARLNENTFLYTNSYRLLNLFRPHILKKYRTGYRSSQ